MIKQCPCCGKDTTNPRFCSRSCAAKITNKESVKRPVTRVCAHVNCLQLVKNHKTSLCSEHKDAYNTGEKYKKLTLGEYQEKDSVKGKHPSWVNSHVRQFNRSWNKDLTLRPCEECGYNKHVELCHIKAVRDFDSNATLGEINHPDNIRVLCPNCHWEYDHM